MAYFTYDTSVFISRKLTDFPDMPRSFRMSAVVLMELIASAPDESRRRFYEDIFRGYQKEESLIIPNEDDWLHASKILYLLTHDRRRSQKGKLQRLPPGASQRLAMDVLIAVSARRWKAQVVTENWSDFKSIQRYCNTRIIKAANFFQKLLLCDQEKFY
jgi:predicted nucleic acid-binding protein